MAYLRPVTKEAKKHMEKIESLASHRKKNKWYKELWFWLKENECDIVMGITIALLVLLSYRLFMRL